MEGYNGMILRQIQEAFEQNIILKQENESFKKEVERFRQENESFKKEVERLNILLDKVKRTEAAKMQQEQNEEKYELAYYIREQRKARAMSLTTMARLVGSNATTLSNYESGEGKIENVRAMAEKIRGLRRIIK